MTCEEIQTVIVKAQGREAAAEEVEAMRSHIETCASCKDYARDAAVMWDWLGEPPAAPIHRKGGRAERWVGRLSLTAAAAILLGIVALIVGLPQEGRPAGPQEPETIRPAKSQEPEARILNYRLLFPDGFAGDKAEVGRRTLEVVRKRLKASNHETLRDAEIQYGSGFITVRFQGGDPQALDACKRLLGFVGKLELKKVASKEIHERFNADGIVPDGFEAYSPPKEVASWIKTKVLVEKTPVITGEDIADAYPDESRGWRISFNLHDAGAKKFDAAAEELYKRDPKGQIGIIVDQQLKSIPAVQSDAFGGRGEITGSFTEQEARDLATALGSGILPVPLGDIRDGKPVPGVPMAEESETMARSGPGAEVTYRLLWEAGRSYDKKKVGEQLVRVLQARLDDLGLKGSDVSIRNGDLVVIWLPGIDLKQEEEAKRVIRRMGKLELKKVASKEVHERFNADGIVPDGFEAYNPLKEVDDGLHPWIKTKLLVEKDPVITGEDIARAYHFPGEPWRVLFTLHVDSAKRFDAAAEELFKRDPKGQIAIIIDYQFKSAPAVQTDHFSSVGEITGAFSEQEARDLAIILRSGSLPVCIGRLQDGKPQEGVPEREVFVGPK